MPRVKGRVRDIRIYGDPVLREKAQPVKEIDEQVLQLIADLVETMLVKDGLGLAANQIGELRSVIALNPKGVSIDQPPFALVNPELVAASGEVEREEGCLSLPGISEVLARPARVKVRGLGSKGKEIEVSAEGTLARALLHEIDHLNGVMFVDHLPPARRKLLKGKLDDLKRVGAQGAGRHQKAEAGS